MIYSIERFLQIHKDTTGKFFRVKSFSYFLCYLNECMICWVAPSETVLVFIQTIRFFKKIVSSFMGNLFKQLIDVWQKRDWSIISYFEFWTFLWIGITIASFRQSGWVPVFIDKLKISLNGIDISFLSICLTL